MDLKKLKKYGSQFIQNHLLMNTNANDAWARTALIALALVIVLFLAYLFSDRIWLRKLGFFGALLMLVVFLISNLLAWQQKSELQNRRGAIVIGAAAGVKSTPAQNGTDLFILHEGTKVNIIDGTMKEWKRVRVADGKEGWIETKEIEVI